VPKLKSFDGVNLFYVDEGEGRPVVLLHGFAADAVVNFERSGVIDLLLGEGFRVIALDARGHGRSDKPTDIEAYTGDAVRRDVTALFDALGLENALMIGYSVGGDIALRFAASDNRAAALVLIGLGTAEDDVTVRDARFANVVAALQQDDDSPDGAFPLMPGLDKKSMLAYLQSEASPFERRPARIDKPSVLIVGDEDTVAGDPEPLAARYGSRLVRVPGSHFSAHASAQAHQTILEFLRAH
jgi:pimeloyl-ACP methyl ester carboxylesterase